MKPEFAATYRLQLRPEFGFAQVTDIVDYLADLGISHVYTSPYLQAAAGSTHGYDVVDPSTVNQELGSAEAHARMCETLQSNKLGHVIDIVPNHMAIPGRQNPWWWDVLENGASSRYALYFDVDWEASEDRWPNKILLPVLGDHYGRILEDKQFILSHQDGVFFLHYHDHVFPLDPSSLVMILTKAAESCESEELAFLAESHARLPRPTVTARQLIERRHRDKEVLRHFLKRLCNEDCAVKTAIDTEVSHINRDVDALDALIDQQNYRLALWRTASRDLGYRRFFDIKDLAGLRIEEMEVFHAIHALPFLWVRNGWVQGFRIDHPDGVRDPADYFTRLHDECPDVWIVAEKILETGEKLPGGWPIDGTTGYDFLNRVTGLFIDPQGEEPLTGIYEEITGEKTEFHLLVRTCKRLVLTELLGSELNRLTSLFVTICERHRRHRDYTSYELREALCETAVCFPVYRSYVAADRNAVSGEDERYITQAINDAIKERPDLDSELFGFLKDIVILQINGEREHELAMRFQQLTGPAMAKGVEDTTFYRFNRMIALNEVGGNPARFSVSIKNFHDACIEAQEKYPCAMLASTTHDTKRSEDVRARLALLSEIPDRWREALEKWIKANDGYRRNDTPDRNTEYLFYQTLVGAWPIETGRLTEYMEKAVREAKIHTSWTAQNKTYERNLHEFITSVMSDKDFRKDVEEFVASLIAPGRINSLAQTLIKLTVPGIPDIYQGTELWNLSLVDPDNRRAVDFTLRRKLLEELDHLSVDDIQAGADEGLPKLWIIRKTLQLRQRKPGLFGPHSAYKPLYAKGSHAEHVVAFSRRDAVITVVPRLIMGVENWNDTQMDIPKGNWRNILTDELIAGGTIHIAEVLSRFPVALLECKD